MSISVSNLRQYHKRHKKYLYVMVKDIFLLMIWKLTKKKIAVITTGSGGVGDYLWIRNYFPIIHQNGYKVILIAMAHWSEIVESFDKDNVDIIRYFESCLSPKKIESLLFTLFKADVFLNFRKECMANIIRSKNEYNNINNDSNIFYEEKNNATFSKFRPLPDEFKHRLPIIAPKEKVGNYVLLVERGNTQGKLSDTQLIGIITYLTNKSYNILYNGDYDNIVSKLPKEIKSHLIDGRKYTFPQYTWLVANALFVVTVNTALYHFALQLDRKCVVISNNEYHTLKLHQANQAYVFNSSLQICYEKGQLMNYKPDPQSSLSFIETKRIVKSIEQIEKLDSE